MKPGRLYRALARRKTCLKPRRTIRVVNVSLHSKDRIAKQFLRDPAGEVEVEIALCARRAVTGPEREF